MVGGMEPVDVTGSLIRGTLIASLIVALLLILFLRRDAFSGFGGLLSHGFGWFK